MHLSQLGNHGPLPPLVPTRRLDFTGSQIHQEVISELRKRGIDVVVARLESETGRQAAERTGLIAKLGEDHVFRSVEDAIQAYKRRPG